MPAPRLAPGVAVAALTGLLVGCGGAGTVEAYKVLRETESTGRAGGGSYRILGAMFPADNPVWFFKLPGRAESVDRYEAEFDKMMASVQLQADAQALPVFLLPDGWKLAGPRSVHAQTVRFGPADAPMEVTITSASGSAGDNAVRWAGQVGLTATPADLPKYTRRFDAGAVQGLRVDVRGPKNPAGGPMSGPR